MEHKSKNGSLLLMSTCTNSHPGTSVERFRFSRCIRRHHCNPVQLSVNFFSLPVWNHESLHPEESDKSGTDKDTNRANGVIKHPRT